MTDEMVSIPRVLGVNLNINFFGEMKDPALVMNIIISDDFLGDVLAHHAGVEGQAVIPLAFIPDQLQQLIPAVIEGVLRARTVQEMVTTWPDQRDSIMENLLFRWTTTLDPVEQGGDDGEQTTS
jgi:hypothetical protein